MPRFVAGSTTDRRRSSTFDGFMNVSWSVARKELPSWRVGVLPDSETETDKSRLGELNERMDPASMIIDDNRKW